MFLICVKDYLPPEIDHRIQLKEGIGPIDVRPYGYPHLQKKWNRKDGTRDVGGRDYSAKCESFFKLNAIRKIVGGDFCVDYRALNQTTIPDGFPILAIDKLLDERHGASVFIKLDLTSGYHQIRVHHEDVPKTVFRTHDVFWPNKCSRHLSVFNEPVFRHYLKKFVLVFFDGIYAYPSRASFSSV